MQKMIYRFSSVQSSDNSILYSVLSDNAANEIVVSISVWKHRLFEYSVIK